MQVQLEKSYPIDAPIGSAWELLQDIKSVAECMPGAAITEQIDDSNFKGTVKVKLGPTTASFKGDIEIKGLDAASRQLQRYGKGTDVRGTSSAAMDLTATLTENGPGACTLNGNADHTPLRSGCNTMYNGIFDDRLQYQRWDLRIQAGFIRDRPANLKPLAETRFFKCQVSLHVAQLISHRHKLARAERSLKDL